MMDTNGPSNLPPARSSLVKAYPMAHTDFWCGMDTPVCIYKSGPEWPALLDRSGWKMAREARPIGRHPIVQTWDGILDSLELALDSLHVRFTSINAFAFADEGESNPFCELLIYITIEPLSLEFNDAVLASHPVKDILAMAGFPELEVAFVELLVTPYSRRKLLSGDLEITTDHRILEVEKPFNTVLGAPIAPLDRPDVMGSAGLVVRIGDQPVVTTCAHFTRHAPPRPPPPIRDGPEVPEPEKFIMLDTRSFNNAVNAMTILIDSDTKDILQRQQKQASADTAGKADIQVDINAAMKRIRVVEALQDEVSQSLSTEEDRVIGSILYEEPVENREGDWALISLYPHEVDVGSANKIFLGNRLECKHWETLLSSSTVGASGPWQYPDNGYLQASSVIEHKQIANPPHLGPDGKECLIVVKNGAATGLTFGCANLVLSAVRMYDPERPMGSTMREIAVLPYNRQQNHQFASFGDSGAVVLDIDGRIVSHITSGMAGPGGITFSTPFWLLERQIQARFPTYSRY